MQGNKSIASSSCKRSIIRWHGSDDIQREEKAHAGREITAEIAVASPAERPEGHCQCESATLTVIDQQVLQEPTI